MKFKLDENVGRRGLEFLKASGHDVMTVWDQGLRGVTDEEVFQICAAEGRVLVTLDRDFGQITRFPPEIECWNSRAGPRAERDPSRDHRPTTRFPVSLGEPRGHRCTVDRRTGTRADSPP